MKLLIKLLFTLSLLVQNIDVKAQFALERRIGTVDGLVFPEVEQIYFMRDGSMWLRYAIGETYSRFDGMGWSHYTPNLPGLSKNLLFLGEDDSGIWWIEYAENEGSYYCFTKDKKWKHHNVPGGKAMYYDQARKHMVAVTQDMIMLHYNEKSDNFVAFDSIPSAKEIKYLKKIYIKATDINEPIIHGYDEVNKLSIFMSLRSPFHFYKIKDPLSSIVSLDKEKFIYLYIDGQKKLKVKTVFSNGKSEETVHLSSNNYKFLREVNLFNNLSDPQHNYIIFHVKHIQTKKDYFLQINTNGTFEVLEKVPSRFTGQSFSIDRLGRRWFPMSSGVLMRDPRVISLSEDHPEQISGLHALAVDRNGHIWMGGYGESGGFSVYDRQTIRRLSFSDYSSLKVLPGSYTDSGGTLYFFVELLGLVYLEEGKIKPVLENGLPVNEIGFYFRPLRNGQVALGLGNKRMWICKLENGMLRDKKVVDQTKGLGLKNIITISEDSKGRLWIGRASEGLALYDPVRDTAYTWYRSDVHASAGIGTASSHMDTDGILWLGTFNGLYYLPNAANFNPKTDVPANHIRPFTLPGNDTSQVTFLGHYHHFLVVGTTIAIHFIERNKQNPSERIFTLRYGVDIPGDGSEQNAIIIDQDSVLWVGTNGGAIGFTPAFFHFDLTPCNILWNGINVAGQIAEADLAGDYRLRKNIRNFTFNIQGTGNPHLSKNLWYNVYIVKNEKDTLFQRIQTQESSYVVDYLPYGSYQIIVNSYKNNELTCSLKRNIYVPRTLEEHPVLYLGFAFLIMLIPLTVIFYKQKQDQLQKKHQQQLLENKRDLDHLRVKTLSNYFNPHFINNSLHWIQSRYRKDPDTTIIVSRLSENVDILFANTQNGRALHSLQEEYRVVMNYLDINKLRFGNRFQVYVYGYDEQKLSLCSYKLPVLSIQIFVENAVEKGLAPIMPKGVLSLTFTETNSGLHIEIADNGIGRNQDVNSDETRISSTQTLMKLVDVYNQYNKSKFEIIYDDHYLEADEIINKDHGTKLTIFIPRNYNYDISN